MRKSFCLAIITSLICAPIAYAAETDLTAVIARLERLEKENAELKNKLSLLELHNKQKYKEANHTNIVKNSTLENSNKETQNNKSQKKIARWNGFVAQISTGYENNKISNTGFMDNNYVGHISSNYFMGTDIQSSVYPIKFDLGYYYDILGVYYMGVGLEYYAQRNKTSYPNYYDPRVNGIVGYKTSGKRSVFLSPAMAIDHNNFIYAKLGFAQQEWKIPSFSVGSTQSGGIVGLGFKRMIYSNLFAFAELNYYMFGESSKNLVNAQTVDVVNFNPSGNSYNLLLGIGYKY